MVGCIAFVLSWWAVLLLFQEAERSDAMRNKIHSS